MPTIIAPTADTLRAPGTYRRMAVACAPETRQEQAERLELENHAFRARAAARAALPRLVRTDTKPLECLPLKGMLQSRPMFDTLSVELSR